MSDELERALAAHGVLGQIEPFLETLDGLVAATRRHGFTEDQSRAIVAYVFGWRAAGGSKPDGTPS